MTRALGRVGSALATVERLAASVSAFLMLAIMLVVTADVFMRYALNSPFSFTYDLVGLYLLAGVFFLTLSDAFRDHVHVSVDILIGRFTVPARRLAEIVTASTGLYVFGLITWLGFQRALDNFDGGDVVAGAIPWPTWASTILVPIGCGLLVLRLVLQLAGQVASLATGRDLYALPPVVGAGEAKSFE